MIYIIAIMQMPATCVQDLLLYLRIIESEIDLIVNGALLQYWLV